MDLQSFMRTSKFMNPFQKNFLTVEWFHDYIGKAVYVLIVSTSFVASIPHH
jgi:hypothetical protein